MAFLERASQLAELHDELRKTAEAAGRAVFLGGEAGVGKSTLVRRLRDEVIGEFRILVGACDPLGTPRPLGPLLDMLDDLGDEVENAVLHGAPRATLFRGILRAITGVRTPALMIIEDAHWADEATLDLIRYLTRRLGAARAMLLVTYRDDEVGVSHPLRILLGDVANTPHVRRMRLPPLTRAAVTTLASGSGINPDLLYRQTGGNAFFVTEILASGSNHLPDTVRDAVLARATRLSSAARALLDIVAVLGPRSELPIVLEIADGSLGNVLHAVEECLGSGVLQFEDGVVGFRHELARNAVLEAISPPRRPSLHAHVLAVLQSASHPETDPARLAHHAEAAGDKEATLRYSLEAAHTAANLSAHREALAQFRRALRVANSLSDDQRADTLEVASFEAYLAGEMPMAIEARRSAVRLRRQLGDRLGEGRNLRHLSRALGTSLDGAGAEAAITQAITVLETLDPTGELAMAYSARSQLHMLAGNHRDAITWGERAIALADQLGELEPVPHSLNNIGMGRLRLGDERGREDLERSLQLAREHGFEDDAARAYINLGSAYLDVYHLDLADHFTCEGIAYCTDHDLEQYRLFLLAQRARVLLYRGQWDDAEATTRGVLESHSSPVGGVVALTTLGRVLARRGDPGATALLNEALRQILPAVALTRIVAIRAARIEAAWLADDRAIAVQEARSGLALTLRRQDPGLLGEMAVWLHRMGGPDSLPADLPSVPPPFDRVLAGDAAGAATEWERRGCPYEAALCWLTEDNPSALRQALAVFERLGAKPAVTMAMRKLRALGVRNVPRGPRPRTRATPGQLTAREIEVLQLVAEGLRNSEIAARLFVSPHTAGHHVSAILAKLNARSRGEAVNAGIRLGLLGQGDDSERKTAK
jgi:DNA-binding CsgD family transcriptional regulator/tetratricopeptide (TPR) repeat protein